MSDIRESVEGKVEKDLREIARKKIDSSDEVVSGMSYGYKYSVYEIDDTTRKRYGLTFYPSDREDTVLNL